MTSTPYWASDDGRATLHHGDALAYLLSMDDASVDAVITDPPYSSGGLYRGDRAGQSTAVKYTDSKHHNRLPDFDGDNRDQRSYAYWCTLWLTQALRVTRAGGILTVSTDWRQLPTLTDAIQAGGWIWRGILAWAKPDARPQLGRYRQACEFIVWATRGARPIIGDCLPGWWYVTTPRDKAHQTEKPLQILRDLARGCPADGLILDPFAGSGTTGVAALAEGRRFVGVEMSAPYVEVAASRLTQACLQAFTPGQLDLFPAATAPVPHSNARTSHQGAA